VEKLIVRNFGAIRDVEIELKALTVFIGESGTGKSTLAKLISIFRDYRFWSNEDIREVKFFKKCLTYYRINNFLEPDSYIEYHSKMGISFIYQKGQILQNFSEELVKNLEHQFKNLVRKEDLVSRIQEITQNSFKSVIYIPEERCIVSDLNKKFAAIEKAKLIEIFPETLIDFTGDFNIISGKLRELYIDFFGVTYQKLIDGDYIKLSNGKQLFLSDAASGMQTAIPTILVLEYFSRFELEEKKSYTIEEPELSLFPTAQKALVEFFVEKVLGCGHELVITTHSPYILTLLNNLLFASTVEAEYPESKSQIVDALGLEIFIRPSNVAVYYLSNNECPLSLIGAKTGVISENDLDRASQDILDSFYELMDIYSDFGTTDN
jgi:predicted ATP-dependent endonuclease of OLD family